MHVFGGTPDGSFDYRTVAQIQKKIIKQSRRSSTPRLFYSKNDQEKIVAWRSELSRILHVFNVRSPTSA